MHDQVASTAALARTLLMEANPAYEHVSVRTASLRLVLEMFLELSGAQPSPLPAALATASRQAVGEGARRAVAGHLASIDVEADSSNQEFRRGRL